MAAALSVCAFNADAARGQNSNVRVGPAAESSSPEPAPDKETGRGGGKSDSKSNSGAGEEARRSVGPEKRAETQHGGKVAGDSAVGSATVSDSVLKITAVTGDAPPKNEGAPVPTTAHGGTRSVEKGAGVVSPGTADAADASVGAEGTTNHAASNLTPPSPTTLYRVGIGDVLDIRLFNQPARESTLYTVMAGGLVEYPLAGEPMNVAGMTTDEIGVRVASELRRRAVYDESPKVSVSVRDYASHAVLVSGLVNDPGVKVLRREAVPLYVVVAGAQPKSNAARAVVMSHATGQSTSVELSDTQAMNMLIYPSDVVSIVERPLEFFYIGGEVAAPGQKEFHAGMTLTQAVLASGGPTRLAAGGVRVSRQGADGRLNSTRYNLPLIQDGKVPDPALRPGDRVEVERKK